MLKRILISVFGLAFILTATAHASVTNFNGYSFEAYVIKSSGKKYREFTDKGQALLKVRPKEEYSIVVLNPLPVRVVVAVSIDGLNTIDGKRTSPRTARKWMIAPNSSITISGWQTSKATMRKFLFTEQSESLAQWREDKDGKKFTRNLGVIGVAWFWNSGELDMALHPPQPFVEEGKRGRGMKQMEPAEAPIRDSAKAESEAKAPAKAGTGMGTRQQNVVTEVEFNDNTGMMLVKDVLKIYYEFAQEPTEPLPFVDEDEDEGRFTPDMHKSF